MGKRLRMPLAWGRATVRQLARLARARAFDPQQEAAFQRYHVAAVHQQARFGIALGLLAWCSFSAWDALAFPTVGGQLVAIRLLLVAPVLAWIWWRLAAASFRDNGLHQRCVLVAPIVAAMGLIAMMETAASIDRSLAFHTFWPAFSCLYFFLYTVLGLAFQPAALVGNSLLILLLALWSQSGLEIYSLAPASLQLGILNFIGMLVCARNEIHLRAEFRTRQHYFRQIRTARHERSNAQRARDQMLHQRQRALDAMRSLEYERGRLALVTAEKERFFAAAYHDLQQPLSIIGLYSHLARHKLHGEMAPDIAADLRTIERAASEIGQMFKGVRDTWEVGHTEVTIEPVDVCLLLDEIYLELNERAEAKGLQFRVYRNHRCALLASTDRTLLKRALSNLVGNAIKYTDRGGVVFGVVPQRGTLRIEVRDSGLGIPPECATQIFEPYFQVRGPERNGRTGLGLGLAIVRQIEAILPGHRLLWHSRVGRGSCFSLELPETMSSRSDFAALATAVSADYADVLGGRYVVVVDDEPTILEGMLQALKSVGCVAEGAESHAATGLLLNARDRCPDLLITDYRLEHGATAHDVVKLLRTRFEWASGIPVLFVTGELMPAAAFKEFHGRYDVYPKPVTHAELLARAARLLSAETTPVGAGANEPQHIEGIKTAEAVRQQSRVGRH